MKTKTIELYEFSELSEEARQKAIENNRDINVDFEWWDYCGHTGFNSKELKRMRLHPYDKNTDELIKWSKMYFDIDRGEYIQFENADFADDEVARRFLGVPKQLWGRVYWSFINMGYGGNSYDSTKLFYESQDGNEFTEKQTAILDAAVERFSDKMSEALNNLRNTYEYLVSDEAIIETIESNEYTFTSEGKMENA